MGGGKHNKGCCKDNPCGIHCIANGSSPCSTESARVYSVQFTTDRAGTGIDCCNNLWGDEGFWYMENVVGSGCTWTLIYPAGPGDCDSVLTISGSSATLTVTFGAYTLVWTSDSLYDPLCISPFYYRPDLSSPPDDCSWPTKLCVNPIESCCPDYKYPDTLEVSLYNAGCPCSYDPPANSTLTRVTVFTPPASPFKYTVEATVRWIGMIDIGSCGQQLAVTVECTTYDDGSGGSGARFYIQFGDISAFCTPLSDYAEESPVDTCDPFIFHFSGILSNVALCCDGVDVGTALNLIVFDPA